VNESKFKKSSSVKKGNLFEKRVYKIFSTELICNRLYFDPKLCKIKKKSKYFSKDRNKEIIVDISLEAYLPNNSSWSQLLVIECKNYNKLVPVDDVEEFYSKLMQIAGSGIKGVIVTPHGFQEGALNYARSKNIGLIKLNDTKDFKWILTRVAPSWTKDEDTKFKTDQIHLSLTQEIQTKNNIEFYANIKDIITTSIYDFIKNLFIDSQLQEEKFKVSQKPTEYCSVPFQSTENIEKLAREVHNKIEFDKSEHRIDSNCKKLRKSFGIKFRVNNKIELDHLGFVILGKIEFNPVLITLSSAAQSNKFRLKFTLAHELGHYFLKHGEYLEKEFYSEQDYNSNYGESISIMDIRRMEWQANQFASYFLLPEKQFIKEFVKIIKQENIHHKGHGVLFVDDQKCNLDSFYQITNLLRDKFRVSRKVIQYRLNNLGLLKDERGKQKEESKRISWEFL